MFEARITSGKVLKQLIEAIRDLITDANIDCTEDEMAIQAMDTSHVSLVAVSLRSDGFDHYRCDRPMSLWFNTTSMAKILKCSGNDDIITLSAQSGGDLLNMMFESPNQERVSDFELKLMDITTEQLVIPDTDYDCNVRMPSAEFQRIIRDMQVLGDTCTIQCSKDGIRFSVSGDLGTGSVLLRPNAGSTDKEEEQVVVDLREQVELTFALRYLNFFTKATSLAPTVVISMSPEVPIVVEYPIEGIGFVKYYLAPKIDDEET